MDIDEEYSVLYDGKDVTLRDSKGEGGNKDIKISKISQRYYCVHEETSYCYDRVWPTDIKLNLLY